MKISKKLAFGAAVVSILSAAIAHASGSCDSYCTQVATNAYNQVIATKSPPLPGDQQCATVPDQYKSQCIASIDAQRAAAQIEAQNAYNFAYGTCMSSCRP
jgi:imidazole glycerol phosphate synthase subunit HisF